MSEFEKIIQGAKLRTHATKMSHEELLDMVVALYEKYTAPHITALEAENQRLEKAYEASERDYGLMKDRKAKLLKQNGEHLRLLHNCLIASTQEDRNDTFWKEVEEYLEQALNQDTDMEKAMKEVSAVTEGLETDRGLTSEILDSKYHQDTAKAQKPTASPYDLTGRKEYPGE